MTAVAGASHVPLGPSLITGAAGFVGRRLVRALRSEGVEVRALVRPEHDTEEIEAVGAQIVYGDAGDLRTVADGATGCDVIFHLAAARGQHKLGHRDYHTENRRLSEAVGRAALTRGCRRVVLASTATLAGYGTTSRLTEQSPVRPNSGYRSSRLHSEGFFEELHRREGLDVVVARLPQRIMGPGARDWTRPARAVRDGTLRFLPHGGSVHSGDVDDIADGLRLCAIVPEIDGQLFLLGAADPMPLVTILRTIADHLGVDFAPRMLPAAPYRAYVALGNVVYRTLRISLPHHFTADFYSTPFALDISRARDRLGYAPRRDMSEAIERTVSWLRETGRV